MKPWQTHTFPRRLAAAAFCLLLALIPMAGGGRAAGRQAASTGAPVLGVVQQWSISSPDAASLDEFGHAVAIDGSTAVVGARNADPNTGGGVLSNAGAAYVYVHTGKTWILQARLTAEDAHPGDTFGVSVAISGNTIVVGATGVDLPDDTEDSAGLKNSGAAYIFTRSGSTWTQRARLQAGDPAEDDSFGSGVAIHKSTVVVAAETKDLPPMLDVGAAYVFNGSGAVWVQKAKLLPPDPWLGDYFGTSVAVDGDLIAVGSPQFNPAGDSGSGKVLVYRRSGKAWLTIARLEAQDGRIGDAFGNALAIDGKTIVVGAQHADPDLGRGRVASGGAAYVFSDTGDAWEETALLTAGAGQAFDRFGQSVDIEGSTIVVGADGAMQAGNRGAGAVYIFQDSRDGWSLQTRAVTDPAGEDDWFGKSVSLSRGWFVAGASGRNPQAKTRAGEVFLNLIGSVQLPATGFAPGLLTRLPEQPAASKYEQQADMVLEIPALGQTLDVVGVPRSGDGWDVRWLGSAAGYLEGTAFPTWQGNTGLAGHSTLADGTPGPFAGLNSLAWGDRLVIHAWGQQYIYEVRDNRLAAPGETSVLRHEDLAWLTLVTCEGYDEAGAAYRWRRVVRAVLVSVEG